MAPRLIAWSIVSRVRWEAPAPARARRPVATWRNTEHRTDIQIREFLPLFKGHGAAVARAVRARRTGTTAPAGV
jgi:hypothetical protein